MPIIGGFFGFIVFMAVMESFGLINYVYAAFWLGVLAVAIYFVPAEYKRQCRRFVKDWLRKQFNLKDYASLPAEQHPFYEMRATLPYVVLAVGILLFLGYCSFVGPPPTPDLDDPYTHRSTKHFFLVWLPLALVSIPAVGLALYLFYEGFKRNMDSLDVRARVEQRATEMRIAKEVYVQRSRELLDQLLPPPGPYFAKAYDLFPRDRFGAIARLASEAGTPIMIPEKVNEKTLTVRDYVDNGYVDYEIGEILQESRSIGFTDAERFRHQFIVGNTGSGKTTYLSAQINADLDRVSRGECSLFVMDSKNELIPQIAKLACFQDGGPLDGALTYIEPNPEYPIALNIFETPPAPNLKEARQAQQSALQLIDFFLSSILQMDATGHQDTLLRYAIPAVLAVPDATLLTLKELLDDGGFERFEPHFRHLRQAEWLKANLHTKSAFNVTRNALRGRIESMLADDTFHDLFCKPRSTLDLSAELNKPRVVLVNTLMGELPVTAGPLGCFFIAKLLQLTEQRTLQRGPKLPVFVYIDEASDYLANNAAVVEIVNKARAQNISFTFAIQGVEDVSADVLAALRRCNIQAYNGTGQRGTFDIALSNRAPVTVRVPNFSFADRLHIAEDAFEELRLKMWKAYASGEQPVQDAPTYQAPRQLFLPPSDDEPSGPVKY